MPPNLFVIVSGLACAGKTTLAGPLAEELELQYLSKDAIKEALFSAVGFGGWEYSKALSRAADAALVSLACELDGAVLDNYWYPSTASELLRRLPSPTVEVFCRCERDVARARFALRHRHPGHADDEAATRLDPTTAADRFPLGTVGPVVEVDANGDVDVLSVAARVRTVCAG